MTFFNYLSLFGGLALFLYGMNVMGGGLEKLAGSKMERAMTKLTSSLWKSVLLGMVVTTAIQSSSATTVIVVGLVNSGIMTLNQSIGVIMGANIGTTITAWILTLMGLESKNFFIQLLKPTALAPLFAIAGIILIMVVKKNWANNAGQILIGFGILFTGLFSMETAMTPLQTDPAFANLFATLSNPILGILAGAAVTAIIQSSSASVGILQALSATGRITFSSAFPIIMGQNIGTCVTALLSSIGASKNAKKAAMVHLYFNVIGTVIMLVLIYGIQLTIGLPFWGSTMDRMDIAIFHTIFNVVTTAVIMPFYKLLGKLAEATIKEDKIPEDDTLDAELPVLDERLLLSPGLALDQCENMLLKMASYAQQNFESSVALLSHYDVERLGRLQRREEAIDRMEVLLSNFLIKLTDLSTSDQQSHQISDILKMLSEFERIGDYSVNVSECATELHETGVSFSPEAQAELGIMTDALREIIQLTIDSVANHDMDSARKIEPLEETIDDMRELLKIRHVERLKDGECNIEAGVIFLDILTNLERISDHCSNVALYQISHLINEFDSHDYKRMLHHGESEEYTKLSDYYTEKYYAPLKQDQMLKTRQIEDQLSLEMH